MIVDFHCHILPYLDDGARDWDEFLAMAGKASAEGIAKILCTPHFIPVEVEFTPENYHARLAEARVKLAEQGLELDLLPGSEVYFIANLLACLKKGRLVTVNNGNKYLLVELPRMDFPLDTGELVFGLKKRGITPIIAHPERNTVFGEQPETLMELIKAGALCQLNMGSIIGAYGEKIRKKAELLLKSGMIHLLGSDAHSARANSFNYVKGLKVLEKLVGVAHTDELTTVNPLIVIGGNELEPYPIELCQKKKTFGGLFFY